MAGQQEATALPTDVISGLSTEQRAEWLKSGALPGETKEKVEVLDSESEAGKTQDAVSVPKEDGEPKNESESGTDGVKAGEGDKGKVQVETKQSPAEKRIKQLLGKVKDQQRELDALKAGATSKEAEKKVEKVEAKPVESKVELRAKPTPTDKRPDGTDKYSTYEDFTSDQAAWEVEKAEARIQAAVDARFQKEYEAREAERKGKETSERDAKIAEANKAIGKLWSARLAEARTRYPDFDEVALDTSLPILEGTVPDSFILDSEYGPDVLYYLARNPEELDRINGLTPIAQARELTKIELKFTKEPELAPKKEDETPAKADASPAPPAVKNRPLPPPMREVGGRGTQVSDPVTSAGIAKDFTAYKIAANLRDLQSRKRA